MNNSYNPQTPQPLQNNKMNNSQNPQFPQNNHFIDINSNDYNQTFGNNAYQGNNQGNPGVNLNNINNNQAKMDSNNTKFEVKKQTLPNPKKKEAKAKIKKLNVSKTIPFKSQEYFTVVDYSRNNIKCAGNELDRGNVNNCLEYLETALGYLDNIK